MSSATFTAGSNVVTGFLTTFIKDVRSGDYVKAATDPDSFLVQVDYVVSNTQLVLVAPYSNTVTGDAYATNWFPTLIDTGALSVAASILTLQPGLGAAASIGIQRNVSTGGRKGTPPLALTAQFALDQRYANQETRLGFIETVSGSNYSGAWFSLTGTDNTQVTCLSRSTTSLDDRESTTITLPNAGTTAAYHRAGVRLLPDRVEFLIDQQLVATHYTHRPDPYALLTAIIDIVNTGAQGAPATLTLDTAGFQSFEDVAASLADTITVQVVTAVNNLLTAITGTNVGSGHIGVDTASYVVGDALAALKAMANYLPGVYGAGLNSAVLVADVPQIVNVLGAGQAMAVQVHENPAGTAVLARVGVTRPAPVTKGGAAFHTVTFAASTTVKLIGCQIADVPNVAIGQFIRNAVDVDSAATIYERRITNVANNGADVDVTLATAYAGTVGAGQDAMVCGFATASYAAGIANQSSNQGGVVLGGPAAAAGDLVFADAETGSTGIGTTVNATRVY